jgi:DNA modification methylase
VSLTEQNTQAELVPAFGADSGRVYVGGALDVLSRPDIVARGSVDLIVTSPPFGLVRKKQYGNVEADRYVDWFRPFGELFKSLLKPTGSLVIDIGGSWIPGQPTRNLYRHKLLIMLVKDLGFHLAQEFFWWNPSKLPTPAEWVNIRRVRVKDAVNCIWWLSPIPWPKASNRRVLQPYSESMRELLENGYQAKLRPSGHDISTKFAPYNGRSIPPNILAIVNGESNSTYIRHCRERHLPVHPARFPSALPEFFIRMLSNRGDLVLDPCAGSCVTGEVAEYLHRRWVCVELVPDYVEGAKGRFAGPETSPNCAARRGPDQGYYRIPHPAMLWNGDDDEPPVPAHGGRTRS